MGLIDEEYGMSEKQLTDKLSQLAYVVERTSEVVGLHSTAELEQIVVSLEEFAEDIVENLRETADMHDPSVGIDSKWLWEFVDEIESELE